jgi:hypothetical protein
MGDGGICCCNGVDQIKEKEFKATKSPNRYNRHFDRTHILIKKNGLTNHIKLFGLIQPKFCI